MTSLVCSEFDEFEDALQLVHGRYLLTRAAAYDWRLRMIELGDVTLMCGQDGATNLFQGSCPAGQHILFMPLAATASLTVDGVAQERGSIAWFSSGREFYIQARGPNRWLAVMVDARAARDSGFSPDGDAALALPIRNRHGRANRSILASLVSLSRQAIRSDAGGLQTGSGEARWLRDKLLRACLQFARSMEPPPDRRMGRPAVARSRIVGRALDLIESRIAQPIHLSTLCRATGVSVRTLQSAFAEQLGVSPHQYLISRRLHGIHAAIRRAEPTQTISEICAQFGVWDFGRIAGAYRRRFGKLPSAALGAVRHAKET